MVRSQIFVLHVVVVIKKRSTFDAENIMKTYSVMGKLIEFYRKSQINNSGEFYKKVT